MQFLYIVHCWEPFIKEEDLTLWKMEEKNHQGYGLYCYKSMYIRLISSKLLDCSFH